MTTNAEERIMEVLTDEWQSTSRITFDAELNYWVCLKVLQSLQIEGKVDMLISIGSGEKSRYKWRKQAPETIYQAISEKELGEPQHKAETQEVGC